MKAKSIPIMKIRQAEGVRVLKRSSCPSLSGKATLAYEIGVDEKTKAVKLRVVANSGGGTWSDDWQSLDDIGKALDRVPKDRSVTADALLPLFRGTSQNSPYFLAAALKDVGVIVPSERNKRCYERADAKAFLDEVKSLLSGRPVEQKKGRREKGASATSAKPKKAKAARQAS